MQFSNNQIDLSTIAYCECRINIIYLNLIGLRDSWIKLGLTFIGNLVI